MGPVFVATIDRSPVGPVFIAIVDRSPMGPVFVATIDRWLLKQIVLYRISTTRTSSSDHDREVAALNSDHSLYTVSTVVSWPVRIIMLYLYSNPLLS